MQTFRERALTLKRAIVEDTREQEDAPKLPFWEIPGVEVVRRKVPYGDYTLDGLEDVVCVERKTVSDLVGSLCPSKKSDPRREEERRFRQRLREMCDNVQHPCVFITGSPEDIHEHRYHSSVAPTSVVGLMKSMWLDFRVPFFFCGSERFAMFETIQLFESVERRYAQSLKGQDEHKQGVIGWWKRTSNGFSVI